MANPTDLKYTRDHQWVRVKSGEATVGITEYAGKQLGDVVFVDLPPYVDVVEQGDEFGSVESVKAVSALFTPASGNVVARNERVDDEPEILNKDPYGDGWLVRIKLSNAKELDELMTSAQYEKFIASGEDD